MASSTPLGWSIGVLFRAWHERVASVLDDVPHGGRGFQILETIDAAQPPTQAALAAHLGIDRTVLTYVIDDLVEAGLIERQADAKDRRVRRLALTDTGRQCLTTLRAKVAEAEGQLLMGLGQSDRDAMQALLGRAAVTVHSGPESEHVCSIMHDLIDVPAAAAAAAS